MEIYEDNLSDKPTRTNTETNNETNTQINMDFDLNTDNETDIVNPYKLITRRIDSTKIRNNQKREIDVSTSTTSDMDIVKDIAVRAGAIIYTKHNNKTFFCLGIDTQSGNLTDFGGGVKKNETIVEGGLRELKEESQGIFGDIDPSEIKNTVTFHCYNMAIMFIPREVDKDKIEQQFKENVRNNPNPEVCDIVWLSTEEFLESIHGRGKKLYIRVRRLLNKVTSTITDL